MRWFVLWTVGVISLVLVGCAGSGSTAPAAGASAAMPPTETPQVSLAALPVNVDAVTVNSLRERDDVVLIDVREDWEYAAGHIPGTQWIPMGQIPSRVGEIPADKTVIIYCRSGNRSDQVTAFLRNQGIPVHNMLGGMIAWEQNRFPVER